MVKGTTLKRGLNAKSVERRKSLAAESRVDAAIRRHGRNDLVPRFNTRAWAIADLRTARRQVRKASPAQISRVAISIARFGFVVPVVINAAGEIIDGHVAVQAARQLGISEVPVIILEHLSPEEERLLRLTLNRLAETGEWDLDELRFEMAELRIAGEDLTVTGFEGVEVDQIMAEPITKRKNKAGKKKAVLCPPVSKEGQLWLLGNHRLFCGDSTIAESYDQALGDRIADVLFTDPPYNCPIKGFVGGLGQHQHEDFAMAVGEMTDAEFHDFLLTCLVHGKGGLRAGGVAYVCIDWRNIAIVVEAGKAAGLTLINMAVWDKGSGGMGGLYRSGHELVPVFCNGLKPATNNVALGKHGRDRTNVWRYAGANRKGSSAAKSLHAHPTPKPVELVEDALLDVTSRGQIVLDPFMGSGTTIIAAEISGRIAAGIEYEPAYVDVAIERWQELTGRDAVNAATGLTFAATAAEQREAESADSNDTGK